MVSQSVRPQEWIIVNDGSTDKTGEIIQEASKEHPWIQAIHRPNRGHRKAGGGVMEAFYTGFDALKSKDWEFLAKLDGDLSFAENYFEECWAQFATEPELGIGGGVICVDEDGKWVVEAWGDPQFHVRGATKIYRRACWEAIGGLVRETGWDTVDEVKANMLGWKTRTFRDLPLKHFRPTGKADGTWANWFKNGRANYVMGYHPLFMLAKCAKRLFRKPYGLGSLALWSGFVTGYTSGANQVGDKAVIRYLRGQQMQALMFRKSLWT
jgi:glycosyltransferase involved in cell wall biosynthesis